MSKLKFITIFFFAAFLFLFAGVEKTYAAVAFDATSESHTGTTGSTSEASFSWSHNPVGTAAGVVVFVFTLATATPIDTSVTYGGTSMSLVSGGAAADTSGEPAAVRAYFLGASVPTNDPATVVVNRTNNSTEMYAIAFTATAGDDTEVNTAGIALLADNGSWAEQSVDDGSTGVNSVRFAGGYAGTNGMPGSGSSSTDGPTIDFGSFNAGAVYETTAGQGSRSVGWSAGGNDDRAAVHLPVREVVSTIDLSGNIYDADESTAYLCSTTGNLTVNLRVDGSGSSTDTCDADTGAWAITGIIANSGATVYIYLDAGSVRGSTVLVTDGTDKTDVDIFTNRVILRDDVNGSITNTEVLAGNTADADDLITTSGTDVTVASTYETHIYTADTYLPGANVETGLLHIDTSATYSGGSDTLTLTGTSGTLIDKDGTFTQGTSTVTVTSASGTPTLLSAATTFHILTINASATVINDGAAITINNAASAALTVTSGVLNLSTTPTGPGGSNGTLTVSSGATLCFGGDAANTSATCDSGTSATTAVTMPTFQTYTLDSAGTVRFLSDAATTISNTPTYGNLVFNPRFVTTSRTYTLGGAMTIDGNFTLDPSESGASTPALTVDAAGTITVAAGQTTTIQASDSATSSLDLRPDSTDYDLSTGLLDVAAGGTLDATDAASTITLTAISGTLFTRVGTFNEGTTTVTVTSASGSPTFNSGTITFNNLTINPGSITITSAADNITVSGTLNVAANDTLSLISGQELTHSGSTLTLNGTISGAGILIYQSSTAFPTSGTLSSVLRMDSTNNDVTLAGNRTYGGDVEIYNNSASARNIVLGSGASQTLTFSGDVTLNAAGAGSVTFTGATNNPTISIAGNLTSTSGGGTEDLTTGTGTWTITGDVDLTDIGTFTATAGNTIEMNGTANLTSASSTLQKFLVSANNVTAVDSMDVNDTFSVTGGTFTHGAGANIDINVFGDFTISDGAAWVENVTATSQVIFDGDLDYIDANTDTKESVGNVVIGTSPETTNLASDFASNSLTVSAGDFFNTCEYEVNIGNGGITINGTFDASATGNASSVSPCSVSFEGDETTINDANNFTINSGATYVADASTLIMDDTAGTDQLITDGSFSLYNLDIAVNASATIEIKDPLDVDNNLTITSGTMDVVSGENNAITVGGSWSNSDTFTAQSGTITFDTSTAATIDSGCADVSSCPNQGFNNLIIDKNSSTDTVTLSTTDLLVTNTLTLTTGKFVQGTLDVRSEGTTAISVATDGTYSNTSTGNLALDGAVSNAGTVELIANNTCGGDNDIAITAVSGTPSWSGSGTYDLQDVSITSQNAAVAITAFSSTNGGSNTGSWTFDATCGAVEAVFRFEGLLLEGLKID